MESLTALHGRPTVRIEIVYVLSNGVPLTAKQLYSKIVKRGNLSITYQAVHKALKDLLKTGVVTINKKGYRLSEKWIQKWHSDAKATAMSHSGVPHSSISKIAAHGSPDKFYKLLLEMLKDSNELRLASKTPALILSSESSSSSIRKRYFDRLLARIKDGSLRGKYLFSTDLTLAAIVKDRDHAAIARMKELLKYDNFDLRHAPSHAIISGAISPKHAIILFPSPQHTDLVGFIQITQDSTKELAAIYDNVFSNAQDLYSFVAMAEKALILK